MFEKPIQKALDLIKTREQVDLCIKYLICPKCASTLAVRREIDEDGYWDIYTCTNKKYLQKRKRECAFKTKVFVSKHFINI